MATENKPKSAATANTNKSKKRKQRYLPQNKPVKKKGPYPLRPGVQGFFITCDGGKERQASHEAINVIDSFYEELIHGKDTDVKPAELPNKPLNKKIKFVYSDDDEEGEEDDNEVEGEEDEEEDGEEENKPDTNQNNDVKSESPTNEKLDINVENLCCGKQTEENTNDNEESAKDLENQTNEAKEPPVKKQCIETCVSKSVVHEKVEQKSIDKLIEDELKEIGDRSKRRFANLDSGCNGVAFVQMRKRDGDPSPRDIVQHMMTSAASTRKHMSRFILRVLPIEVSCYASEEEISKAMTPVVAKYFPVDTREPQKFAVLYEARANTGIDRMKIINSVAKSVPGPHKVDLSNPDKTIVVEIVRTVCLIGVVEKYKELAKYNLRQLTSPKQ
ncbi:hypothetical protein P3X46_030449 [Hevea brasiliensis]|uniref:THUMP domain-containing protein n=1 Tax=Hevea brasiliensis TaxID=3981 RepID=A0ABQ9KIZ4_HEVBR|nr:uncharacterized protein LOC110662713 isoform X1 [Hevea brasiliensis]KAJ9139744.1 hypothetical protein P3X46_030449 [Hevea brasiliensis]